MQVSSGSNVYRALGSPVGQSLAEPGEERSPEQVMSKLRAEGGGVHLAKGQEMCPVDARGPQSWSTAGEGEGLETAVTTRSQPGEPGQGA